MVLNNLIVINNNKKIIMQYLLNLIALEFRPNQLGNRINESRLPDIALPGITKEKQACNGSKLHVILLLITFSIRSP